MRTHRDRFLLLLLPGVATLAMGCGGYTSSYVPPADGRPRLVWSDDKPVPMMSNPMPEACSEAVGSLTGGSGSIKVGGRVGGGYVSGGYYVPARTVVVVHGGPLFVPVPHPIGVALPHGGRGGGGVGGIGRIGGGGGGSGDLGKGAVLLVVVAIATLPFIALGLAVGRPEPEGQVAAAIDHVNAQTDLARTEGSPCDEMTVAGEGAAQ